MSICRYKTNPFLGDLVVPVKGRQVRISKLGKDDNVLVNQTTGEIHGTHVTSYKKVDAEQFIKIFTANIGMAFDLTSAGIKAFTVLLWVVQNKALAKDEVDLDVFALDAFLGAQEDPRRLSPGTFRRGISELEKARIVAKTIRQGRYFINPNFVFNGDRIAFTNLIEREGKAKPEESSLIVSPTPDRDPRVPDMFE
jgi:hypothetical protein